MQAGRLFNLVINDPTIVHLVAMQLCILLDRPL